MVCLKNRPFSSICLQKRNSEYFQINNSASVVILKICFIACHCPICKVCMRLCQYNWRFELLCLTNQGNVSESITAWCQFHQHLMSIFLHWYFWRQNVSKPKHSFVIFGAKILYQCLLIGDSIDSNSTHFYIWNSFNVLNFSLSII